MTAIQSQDAAPALDAERSPRRMRMMLSTPWIFVTLNYMYCGVLGLTDQKLLRRYLTGTVNGIEMTQGSSSAPAS